jgi:hypothetical protein
MTQIINHGKWVPYQPDKLPEYAPPGARFARRESDGVDWYEYLRDEKSFSADTVKFAVMWQDAHNGYVVSAATRDPTRLFPADMLVREIIDYHGGDPQAELGSMLYDPDTHRLRTLPELQLKDPLQPILDRLAVIEARLGITP